MQVCTCASVTLQVDVLIDFGKISFTVSDFAIIKDFNTNYEFIFVQV